MNSGLKPEALQQITERAGNAGDLDFVSLLIAARATGLDINKAGEGADSIIGALTRKDSGGELVEGMRDLGLTNESSINERVSRILEARQEGVISQAEYEGLIGGAQNQKFFEPFERALKRGLVEQTRTALTDSDAAENTITELRKNEFVRAEERRNIRELRMKAETERSSLTPLGEELADADAAVDGYAFPIRWAYHIGNLPNYLNPTDPEQTANRNADRAADGQTVIYNTTNIAQQNNGVAPPSQRNFGEADRGVR